MQHLIYHMLERGGGGQINQSESRRQTLARSASLRSANKDGASRNKFIFGMYTARNLTTML